MTSSAASVPRRQHRGHWSDTGIASKNFNTEKHGEPLRTTENKEKFDSSREVSVATHGAKRILFLSVVLSGSPCFSVLKILAFLITPGSRMLAISHPHVKEHTLVISTARKSDPLTFIAQPSRVGQPSIRTSKVRRKMEGQPTRDVVVTM
jgi:hypothetical protein